MVELWNVCTGHENHEWHVSLSRWITLMAKWANAVIAYEYRFSDDYHRYRRNEIRESGTGTISTSFLILTDHILHLRYKIAIKLSAIDSRARGQQNPSRV